MSDAHRNRESGFTYLGVLFAVALIGIMLAAAGEVWSVRAQREREVELLYVGEQYAQAIRLYYTSPTAGARKLPMALEELVDDERAVVPQHHLRRMYPDPMTGAVDWQLLKAADGGIYGVYSSSQAKPLKRTNFKPNEGEFAGAVCYCDWKFVFQIRR